ncbi:MAG: histidine kinase [Flavobacteriaceae bacterium]
MRAFIIILVFLIAGITQVNSQVDKRESSAEGKAVPAQFRALLDSAQTNKRIDIDKSIDFIVRALESLADRGNEKERALALSRLGEIYQYHQQFDLAISNYRDAQAIYKTTQTALLLGQSLLQISAYKEAESTLLPLIELAGMVPYQRIQLYEGLGDAFTGLGDTPKAVTYYEEGLKIARKNRIAPKVPDLNSKIADVYAKDNRAQEAEAYYGYSLDQAAAQTPKRAVRENEKVADFYNREGRYEEEIKLRKKSLSELGDIQVPAAESAGLSQVDDSISAQQINYKIANAYVEQDKTDEAIPYLVESIRKADVDDDLEVKKDATRKLSEVYSKKGDFSRALESYQQYVAVVDTLYQRKEIQIAQAARFNREIAAKQSRISSLERDRQLSQSKFELAITQQQLSEETNRRQKWLIYSLILLILLTALAAFFFYRSNRQQKLANNLLALKSLRSQMNPHFIFNALNSVNSYIAKSDERSANRYLSDFSSLMRAVLENSEDDFIPLSKEMELIGLYLKLEKARFPDKFDYKVEIDPGVELSQFEIPPMLLQPYVENAVWHGLRYKEDKGLLAVRVNKEKDQLQIIIEDNGIGRKQSAKLKTRHQSDQKSTAMNNIKDRLKILNKMGKHKIGVEVSDLKKDGTGTHVLVTLRNKR